MRAGGARRTLRAGARAAVLALLAALLTGAPAQAAPGAVVKTDQVRAELLAHAPQGVAPGQPLWLGLRIEHAPHWHTYWKNPGDSGLPTSLEWTLPAGFAAGPIQWPTPKPLPVGPLMNFGYEGTLLLPVPVQVPAGFAGQALEVRLQAEWLVCKDVCIPESGEFALRLPAQAATAAHGALFEAARAAQPQVRPGALAQAQVEPDALQLRVSGLPADWAGRTLRLFPELPGVIDNAAAQDARWVDGAWVARVRLSAQRSQSPERFDAVLAQAGASSGAGPAAAPPAGVQLTVQVSGAWPPAGGSAGGSAGGGAGAPALSAPPPASGLAVSLLLALLGGALLNLMPCVFPVLSLKVLGLAAHGQQRRAMLAGGLAYTAGVVVSFLALAGLLLVLRAGGEQLGWGFQLQSPLFVAALAALFTLIGLNLAGVFEFGSVLPGSVAGLRARHPVLDAGLTGVLAVAVASPCTAPFMGAALGLAATLPAPQALSIFAALGLGMALPLLAASAFPALARALPRPGAWMVHFKVLMAFPMFATVIWLAWVLGQQAGIDAVAALLGVLLALALLAWALGRQEMSARARRAFCAVALAVLAAALSWAWPALQTPDSRAPATAPGQADSAWEPWSPERVTQALAEGRPVFIDFTAAWCVTCQFNKRNALADARVLADFQTRRVRLLRADWTRRDPQITQALAALSRNGVPVYVLMAPGAAGPRILSEILSVDEVRSALAELR